MNATEEDLVKRLPLVLTDGALERMADAAICRTERQADAIETVLWLYELAGKEAPDFGRLSELAE